MGTNQLQDEGKNPEQSRNQNKHQHMTLVAMGTAMLRGYLWHATVTPTATLTNLLKFVVVTESYVHGSIIYRSCRKTVFKEEAFAWRKSDPCL